MTKTELRQAAGQLMIIGFDGTEANARLNKLLADVNPGGAILFARNIVSAGQCHDLIAHCQKAAAAPLFRCIDLEGGTVDRFRKIIAPAPSQREVAATGKRALFRKHGEVVASEARALGFNVDFAPVSDLGFPASASVLTTRTVSADAKQTVDFIRAFLTGLDSQGVLGCGKHFPGLGEGNLDSHHDMPVIDKSWKKLWAEDLMPYRVLHRRFPFVMLAHAAYPQVSGAEPASLSKRWLTEILKRRIGFRNISLADDLEMGGVLKAGSVGHAAVETLRAGADMFLVCHLEENVRAAFEAVVIEAEKDSEFARLVTGLAAHVKRCKKRWKVSKAISPRPTEAKVKKLRALVAGLQRELDTAGARR
jgi:beta-N-acetylhexosaminidase